MALWRLVTSEARRTRRSLQRVFAVALRRLGTSEIRRSSSGKCSSEVRRAFEEAVTIDVSLCCELTEVGSSELLKK